MQHTRATAGPFTLRIDRETRRQLHTLAKRHNIKMGVLVRQALAERLPVWMKEGVTLRNG